MNFKKDNYLKEENFYDSWVQEVGVSKIDIDKSFLAITAPENRYILEYLGDLNTKRILEIGCGFGEASVYFAKNGAKVVASDISDKIVDFVKELADFNKVKMDVCKCAAEKLPFPDNSFDVVYAANVLHHVNIKNTIKEVKRVLKNGGSFVCWDPLAHNPLINIYRRKASRVRTKSEHPLKLSEVRYIKNSFNLVKVKFTWLLTLWIFIKFYIFEKIDLNKERYWKKVISEADRLKSPYIFLEKVDKFLLKLFPFLNKYCWNVVIMGKNEK